MIPRLALLALLPIFAVAAFVGVTFYFYQGTYDPPPSVDVPFQDIRTSAAPSRAFTDSPATQLQKGLLLVDALHSNAFKEAEIAILTSRLASRGYDVEFMGNFDVMEEEIRLHLLEEKLRRADSLVVILPQEAYSEAETALVERFVRKGGKLLLISDPSRPQRIDTLAERFGLDFQPDYLYNLSEYDQNFRHIFVRDFQPDELTAGLDTVILDIAGSIRSSGPGVAFAGANTESSFFGPAEGLYPIAWGDSRNVLAIANFTFMVPPNNSLLDNDRLVSNIADYVTDSERKFDLADFPYFFESGSGDSVHILLGQPSLLNIGLQVKNGLSSYLLSSQIRGVEDVSRDMVFLGLYEDALQVSQYLQVAGVRVDDTLGTLFAPDLDLEGTSVTVLDQNQDRYVLVILADTPETLTDAVTSLIVGEYRGDLVSDFVGVSKVSDVMGVSK